MHDSVPVPPVTRSTEREVLQLYVKSSELYDLKKKKKKL